MFVRWGCGLRQPLPIASPWEHGSCWGVPRPPLAPRVWGNCVWSPASSVRAPLSPKCWLILQQLLCFLFGTQNVFLGIGYLKEICPVVSSLQCLLLHPQGSKQEVIYTQCNFEYKVLQLCMYEGEDNIAFGIFTASENTGQRNYPLPHTVHWQTISGRLSHNLRHQFFSFKPGIYKTKQQQRLKEESQSLFRFGLWETKVVMHGLTIDKVNQLFVCES